jgi:hypothetical protein
MLLHGHRIVFTGASSNAAVAIAEAFLALGAELVAADLRRTSLIDLRTALANHERLRVAECDLEDPAALRAFFDSVVAGGPVDALVHAPPSSGAVEPALAAALAGLFGQSGRIVLLAGDPALALAAPALVERRAPEAGQFGVAINAVLGLGAPATDLAKAAVWLAGPAPRTLTGSSLRLPAG